MNNFYKLQSHYDWYDYLNIIRIINITPRLEGRIHPSAAKITANCSNKVINQIQRNNKIFSKLHCDIHTEEGTDKANIAMSVAFLVIGHRMSRREVRGLAHSPSSFTLFVVINGR